MANFVFSPNGGGAGTLGITVDRSHRMVAPDSVRMWPDLSATTFDTAAPTGGAIYDARLHDLIYIWDFDDGTSDWSAPTNVLTGWKTRTHARGPFVAHMYTQPGTYNPSLTVIEPSSGKQATHSLTGGEAIVVADPDTYYAGTGPNRGTANTVCINPTGDSDFTGAPAGADTINGNTINTALLAGYGFNGSNWDGPKRFLLKRGEEYDIQFNFSLHDSGVYIGAYGSGADPIVNAIGTSDPSEPSMYCTSVFGGPDIDKTQQAPDVRVVGLNFKGTHDPTSEWSGNAGANTTFGIRCVANVDLMASACTFDGHHAGSMTVQPNTKTSPNHYHADDCIGTNLGGDFPFYMSSCTHASASFATTGCRLAQVPGGVENDATNASGIRSIIRLTSCPNVHSRCTDFYHTDASAMSYRISGTPEEDGHTYNIHSCSFEGGFGAFTICGNVYNTGGKGVERSTVHNGIFEGNIWVGSYSGAAMALIHCTGITFRNNLCLMPDTQFAAFTGGGTSHRYYFQILDSDFAESYDPTIVGAAPIRLYNNTLVCERDMTENNNWVPVIYSDDTDSPGFTNIDESNNVLHQPNLSPATTTFADLVDSGAALWTPRNPGRRDPATFVLDASYATASTAVQPYNPEPGSAAFNAAEAGKTAWGSLDDLYAARGASTANWGAWE